ncbi:Cu-Zn family superoxide dismutase [Salirhabdus euzebyi]|uniref:Superoxide dismutase [Cu-Zn] n=1 Tax=Salirhabdus euzebyi TaxID=394506 RepID=A0A841Q4W4_9BACI|nr:superoxide dismutase family protein [Salirhabdus euzebyi]MBB6453417.1 Cu-Zn family superoxide dismutase [Salirhabdus euzebyi]
MIRYVSSFFLVLLVILSSCNDKSRSPLEIDIYNPEGDSLGTATLSEQAEGVKIKLNITGLEPGFHAIHIHEFPKCEGPDFKSAGNHFNPDSKLHGLMHPEGAHVGDMPNVEAAEDGKIDGEVTVEKATLADDKYSLLKGEGTSLVIHESQDNGMSQPAGDAGARVACGKITLAEDDKDQSPTNPAETGPEEEEK